MSAFGPEYTKKRNSSFKQYLTAGSIIIHLKIGNCRHLHSFGYDIWYQSPNRSMHYESKPFSSHFRLSPNQGVRQ